MPFFVCQSRPIAINTQTSNEWVCNRNIGYIPIMQINIILIQFDREQNYFRR